jgi:hypothetical protein
MPYTNVDIFREKGAKKIWVPLSCMEKGVKKMIVDFFVAI